MSGHGVHAAQSATAGRCGRSRRRWLVVGATGVLTAGLFGAAANADDGDPGRDGPRAAAPTTTLADDTPTDDTETEDTSTEDTSTEDTSTDDTSTDDTSTDETSTDDTAGGDGTPIPPDDLGTDAELDALAERCFDGDLLACDHLFLQSPIGSEYEEYGDTCGGREEPGTENYCELGSDGDLPPEPTDTTEPAASGEPIPPDNLGSDAELNTLATECYVGDMEACDDLYLQSDEGSEYRTYGDTCAGRQPEFTGRLCTSLESPVPGTGPVASVPATTDGGTVAPSTAPGEIPPATEEPVGLGNDAALDALAQACFGGDMAACDNLYNQSEPDTAYRRYGDTCAGRQPEDTGIWCRTAFGGTPSTDVTLPATSAPPAVTTVPVPLPPLTTAPPATVPDVPTVPVPTVAPTVPLATQPLPTQPLPTIAVPTVPVPTAAVPTLPPLPTLPSLPTVPTAPTTAGPPTVPSTTIAGAVPPPTMQPTGLGVDPTLDALAQRCYDGDMAACDELYRESDADDDPLYREFADTCAGRQPSGTGRWCEDAFAVTGVPTTVPGVTTLPSATIPGTGVSAPSTVVAVTGIPPAAQQPTGLGVDPTLDALAQRCFAGEMPACDDLFLQSELGTPYHEYGDTCAGRQPAGTYTYCHVAFPGTQP